MISSLLFFIIVGFIFLRKKKDFILYIPIINVISDSSLLFNEDSFIHIGDIRVIFISFYILFYIFNYRIKQSSTNLIIYFLGLLCFILIMINSSNINYSLVYFFKIYLSFLVFIIAKNYFENFKQLKKLNFNIIIALSIQITVTVLSNVLNLGESQYMENGFHEGTGGAPIVLIFFSICIIPLFIEVKKIFNIKINTNLIYILVFSSIIIIFLAMRRTTIASLILAIFIFITTQKDKLKTIKYIFIFIVGITSILPFFSDKIIAIYNYRFVEHARTLEDESRFRETKLVFDQLDKFDINTFFGIEPFNSIGFNMKIFHAERQFHTFHSITLHGIGIIGFIAFLLIYLLIFAKLIILNRKNIRGYRNVFFLTTISIFFFYIIQITSFGVELISMNFIVFSYVGAFIGIYSQKKILKNEWSKKYE